MLIEKLDKCIDLISSMNNPLYEDVLNFLKEIRKELTKQILDKLAQEAQDMGFYDNFENPLIKEEK